MQSLESILENKTHKILWEPDLLTDHLISARRLDQLIINKKGEVPWTLCPHRPQSSMMENEVRDNYLDLTRELKNNWRWKWRW